MELLNAIASDKLDVIRFLLVMAICNTVVPTKRLISCLEVWFLLHNLSKCASLICVFGLCSKSGEITYKAQSQDEDALVHAAALLNMVFINKNGNFIG